MKKFIIVVVSIIYSFLSANLLFAASFSQADLTGTWNMRLLSTTSGYGYWFRGIATIASDGSMSAMSCLGSDGGTTCPTGSVMTINSTTGVITMTLNGNPTDFHGTMTSNKNFVAATKTGGEDSELLIMQKVVPGTTYNAADIQSKSFVYHSLSVGTSNGWEYAVGSTDETGEVTISSETNVWNGTTTPGDIGGTISVDGSGVVTMSAGVGMDNFQGFLSDDKKTIVGTVTETGKTNYRLMIFQITGRTYTAGTFPAGSSVAHTLATSDSYGAFWLHYTSTVDSSGVMNFSDWVSSNSGVTAPTSTMTGRYIDASGTVTIDGNPTYHGQVSDDKTFVVGTRQWAPPPTYLWSHCEHQGAGAIC